MRLAAITLLISVTIMSVCRSRADTPTEQAPSDKEVGTTVGTLVVYCSRIDGGDVAQLKTRAETCKAIYDNLALALQTRASLHKAVHDADEEVKAGRKDGEERAWGTCWNRVMLICDGVAGIAALLVLIMVLRGKDGTSLLREATGKPSFARVFGFIAGMAALCFVGLVTNICLSFLFLTGKMPDQLGTTYAAAVGTFFTAIIPYLIGKLKQPQQT
jgi:hypothetical protein